MVKLIAALAFGAIGAQEVPNPGPASQAPGPGAPKGWILNLLPAQTIYAPYLADPRQSRTATKVATPVDSAGDDLGE